MSINTPPLPPIILLREKYVILRAETEDIGKGKGETIRQAGYREGGLFVVSDGNIDNLAISGLFKKVMWISGWML